MKWIRNLRRSTKSQNAKNNIKSPRRKGDQIIGYRIIKSNMLALFLHIKFFYFIFPYGKFFFAYWDFGFYVVPRRLLIRRDQHVVHNYKKRLHFSTILSSVAYGTFWTPAGTQFIVIDTVLLFRPCWHLSN